MKMPENPKNIGLLKKKSKETTILTLFSLIFICGGIILDYLGSYWTLQTLISVGDTAIGSGIIGLVYDLIVREESGKELNKQLIGIINNWDHLARLRESEIEKIIITSFRTFTANELAEGCWRSFIKPMFLQKGFLIRENFSHEALIKRINEDNFAQISVHIRYTEKNKGMEECSLFKNVKSCFAILSSSEFSHGKDVGKYIYVWLTPFDLSPFYEHVGIDIDLKNIKDIKKVFDVTMMIGDIKYSLDIGNIKINKIDSKSIIYELESNDVRLAPGEEKTVHIYIDFLNRTLRTYMVNIIEVTKDVTISLRYISDYDKRKVSPYVFFNTAPTVSSSCGVPPNSYILNNDDFSQVNFDGWIFPLSGVVFTLFNGKDETKNNEGK